MTGIDFKALFEQSPALLMVLSPDLTIITVSNAYARATMIRREDVAGRHLFDVFPDNPDDPDATGVSNLRASLDRVRSERTADTMAVQKYDVQRPAEAGGGFEERHWSCDNTPVFDESGAIACIVHRAEDVTDYVRLKQARSEQTRRMETDIVLRAQEIQQLNRTLSLTKQRFAAILDNARDAILAIDPAGLIRLANFSVSPLFGYPVGALEGRSVETILPGFLQRHEQTRDGDRRMPDLQGRRGDGTLFPAELSVGDFALEDGPASVLIVRDVSERRRLERLKSEFVSTVNHELRTPLTSIRGALELLGSGALGEVSGDMRNLLDIATRNTHQLMLLVNDLLDLEKLDSGQAEFRMRPVDLDRLLQQAIEMNQTYADQYDVAFRLVKPQRDAWVIGDPDRLLQVLGNLLSNAAKFSHEKGTVDLGLEKKGRHLRIFVQDHGDGIPDNFRPRVFQRFAQADSSDQRRRGGTGLGLSISKAIIEHHHGEIDFETADGVGTRFWFDLPLAAPAPNS